MSTFEHDAVIATLAERASAQVKEGLASLHAGRLVESEVFLNAACATMQSLVALLDGPAPAKPMRKLCVVQKPREEEPEIQPWMSRKFGGPDDGAA